MPGVEKQEKLYLVIILLERNFKRLTSVLIDFVKYSFKISLYNSGEKRKEIVTGLIVVFKNKSFFMSYLAEIF